APFGVLAAVALARWLGQPATPFPTTPFHAARTSFLGALGIGISQSIWNYSGWDNASTIGGEIEQASATYPRALARTLPLVTAVYLLTILPALALTDWTTWTDGAWPRIAGVVVGPWLGVWIAGAGLVRPFGGLLAGDVLLYSAALALEFGALLQLRRAEPELRGAFRVPLGVPALVVLGALPILLILSAVGLEIRSREVGLPGVLVAGLLA